MKIRYDLLLLLCVMGCNPSYEHHQVKNKQYFDALASLASEAVRSKSAFWPDKAIPAQLESKIHSAMPFVRSGGIYQWSFSRYSVELDLLDEIGYLPGKMRGRAGKLNVRVIKLAYPISSECYRVLEIYVSQEQVYRSCANGEKIVEKTLLGDTLLCK